MLACRPSTEGGPHDKTKPAYASIDPSSWLICCSRRARQVKKKEDTVARRKVRSATQNDLQDHSTIVAEPIKQPTEDSTEDLTRTVTLETYVDDTSSGSEDESTLERARVHPMLRPEEKEEESVIFYSPAAEALRLKRLAMAAKSIRPELGDETEHDVMPARAERFHLEGAQLTTAQVMVVPQSHIRAAQLARQNREDDMMLQRGHVHEQVLASEQDRLKAVVEREKDRREFEKFHQRLLNEKCRREHKAVRRQRHKEQKQRDCEDAAAQSTALAAKKHLDKEAEENERAVKLEAEQAKESKLIGATKANEAKEYFRKGDSCYAKSAGGGVLGLESRSEIQALMYY